MKFTPNYIAGLPNVYWKFAWPQMTGSKNMMTDMSDLGLLQNFI